MQPHVDCGKRPKETVLGELQGADTSLSDSSICFILNPDDRRRLRRILVLQTCCPLPFILPPEEAVGEFSQLVSPTASCSHLLKICPDLQLKPKVSPCCLSVANIHVVLTCGSCQCSSFMFFSDGPPKQIPPSPPKKAKNKRNKYLHTYSEFPPVFCFLLVTKSTASLSVPKVCGMSTKDYTTDRRAQTNKRGKKIKSHRHSHISSFTEEKNNYF